MPYYVLYFGDFSLRDDGFLQNVVQGQWRNHTAEPILFSLKENSLFFSRGFLRSPPFCSVEPISGLPAEPGRRVK